MWIQKRLEKHSSLTFIGFSCGFVLLYVGNAKTSTVVSTLKTTVIGAIDTASTRMTAARNLAQQLPYTNNSDAFNTFVDAQVQLASFKTETTKVADTVSKYDGYRKSAIFVGSLIPLAMIIAAAVLILCNCCKPAMGTIAWFLVFLSIIVWICMGVHLAIGKGLSDVCYEVDLAEAQGENGVLAILIKCQEGTTPLSEVQSTVDNGISQAVDGACSAMNQTCITAGGTVDCGLWHCEEDTIDEYPDFSMTDVVQGCSDNTYVQPTETCPGGTTSTGPLLQTLNVSACPTQCRNTDFRAAADDGLQGLATLTSYLNLRTQITPLLSCDFVADAFFSAKKSICTTFKHALTLVFVGAALEGLGMGLAMAALVHCFMGLSGEKKAYNPRDTL